jgi:hypothetical protein
MKGRGGIRADVLEDGLIPVGDPILPEARPAAPPLGSR